MIKQPFLIAMINDAALREKLAEANNCKQTTIQKWLRRSDVMLTTVGNLNIIKNHFGLSDATEILEQEQIGESAK